MSFFVRFSPPKPDPVVTATGNQPHVLGPSFPRAQAVIRGPADSITTQLRVLDECGVPLIVRLVTQDAYAAVARGARKNQPQLMGSPRNAANVDIIRERDV